MRPFTKKDPHKGVTLRRTLSGGYAPLPREGGHYWKPEPNTVAKLARRRRGKLAKLSRRANRR